MVKISISLPNNAQITFESEESEVLREIISLALRDLPRNLMETSTSNVPGIATKKGKSNGESSLPNPFSTEPTPIYTSKEIEPESQPNVTAIPPKSISSLTKTESSVAHEFLSNSDCTDFEAFCKDVNPLGDMRRVVVAAAGAMRYFGVDGVNAADLEWLFDAAGWRKPGDFTQTLRNAARTKFGWLERIPGRSGRYAATPIGLSKTISIT